jgi:TPR repeat protein
VEDACESIGYARYDGVSVRHDYLEEIKEYLKLCDSGVAQACNSLGHEYYKGSGLRQDFVKAIGFYEKGCRGKVSISCDALAFAYYFGIGTEYYSNACELGEIEACMKIATAYERGIGVEINVEQAQRFLGLACGMKDQWACDEYQRLTQQ